MNELLEWSFEVSPRLIVRLFSHSSLNVLDLDSEPQPDLAWLTRKDYSKAHPTADDVLHLVEVSDSSMRKDRAHKLELYAEANIRDYWIVDIQNRCIDVYRDSQGSIYRSMTTYTPGQESSTLAFPDLSFPVVRLFPD